MERVSAVVCTRNRPGSVGAAVGSLLQGADPLLEVIVIDQSDGAESERALAEFGRDVRFRYVRSERRGKGAALNQGLELSSGSVVAFTDDDCIAPPGWARDMAERLRERPASAILFCRVIAVPYDAKQGYVPAYDPPRPRTLRSIADARHGFGLGAAMALRRDVIVALGGFDESFGPGGRFPSGDEWDVSIRALLKGWHVEETTALAVTHDGFRSFAEGKAHARRDWIALGAVCAKPLRAGHLRAAVVPLWFFPQKALWPPLDDLLHGRRPRGLGRVAAFVRGFLDGLAIPVDPKTLRFR